MLQLATLHAMQVCFSALSSKPGAQVTQPWQASTFITVQLVTEGHCRIRDECHRFGQASLHQEIICKAS